MALKQYDCPSCGAPLEVKDPLSKILVCPYCSQACHICDEGLDPTGKASQLADYGSMLSVGYTAAMGGVGFRVFGRLRYQYDGGFWDEWFLCFDDSKKAWLQEDEGEFSLFEKEPLRAAIPPFDEISVASSIEVNGRTLFVTEKNRASIAGAEGELFFRIVPGQSVNCVDGNCGGMISSIEFAPDEINLSVGREISAQELS